MERFSTVDRAMMALSMATSMLFTNACETGRPEIKSPDASLQIDAGIDQKTKGIRGKFNDMFMDPDTGNGMFAIPDAGDEMTNDSDEDAGVSDGTLCTNKTVPHFEKGQKIDRSLPTPSEPSF